MCLVPNVKKTSCIINFILSSGMLMGYHFQWKVYERGSFSVKNGIKRVGVGHQGRASPYKTLLSSPPPPPLEHSGEST